MNNIQIFDFSQDSSVRIIIHDGKPYFAAKDVCQVLEISNVGQALTRLDDDERTSFKVMTLGGVQNAAFVNESGLYSLIISSRKPEAKRFKKWVTSEVLPSIRETGSYNPTANKKHIPFHLRRQVEHARLIPSGYFSMLSEMCAVFIAPLEMEGAPTDAMDRILPDISLGRMFCEFLRKNGVNPESLPTYKHTTPMGKVVDAKLYPEELIGKFRRFVREVWIPEKSQNYLKEKCPELLPFLPKLLK